MQPTSAGSDSVGIREWTIAPLQLDQRFLTLLAVNVQHKNAALRPGHNADVGIGPKAPPFADHGRITAGVFQAVGSPRMLGRTLALRPPARAAVLRRRMEWNHKPTVLRVFESGAGEIFVCHHG